jgi:mRNA-degrading endonuclease RelE of RelBE toxin-antitoxin system
MTYKIYTIDYFDKQLKKLVKKYPSLKSEIIELINSLKENPNLGTPIGNNCYKIRLAISSKGKGKSGGARVISYVVFVDNHIFLLSIYDKSNQDSISDTQLLQLLEKFK